MPEDATAAAVEDWLTGLGLGQYGPAFRDNDVDLALLADLTSEDLREIGITSVGHRRRILSAAALLATRPPAGPPVTPSVAPPETSAEPPALADPSPPSAEGLDSQSEQRVVTAMFCDLVGSTRLSSVLYPEDYRDLIARFRDAVAAALVPQDGHVARFLGDGIVVFFGLSGAQDHAAETAVATALAILGRTRAMAPVGGQQLQVRIGIATGLSVIETDQGKARPGPDGIVGEIPNLAARLQAVARPDSIVIAQSTRDRLGNLFLVQDLGDQALKGLAQGQRAWRVLGHAEVGSRFEALRPAARGATLVGRRDELDLLVRRTAAVRAAGGLSVTLIQGESGIGKSRLAREALMAAGQDPAAMQILQCTPYHAATPFLPLRRFLGRKLAGLTGLPDRPARIAAFLAQHGLDGAGPAALLDDLVAEAEREDLMPRPVSSQRQAQSQRQALVALLTSLTRGVGQKAGVILIEDIQWIDPSTTEILSRLAGPAAGAGWHLVATARPGPLPDWCQTASAQILKLDRLPPAEFADLIRAVASDCAPGVGVTDAQVTEIALRCDGNPVFAEELTRFRVEGLSASGPQDETALPATLADSLLARLDRLATGRRLAQTASVIGLEFPVAILYALSGLSEAKTAAGLAALNDAGILQPAHSPFGPAVGFRHMLLQDAAYMTLLRRDRIALHARIAETLTRSFPDLAEALPQVVAHQLSRSGQARAAADHWQRAGTKAARRSAYAEAIAHYRRALEDLATPGREAEGAERAELDIRLRLVSSLVALHGFGAPVLREEMPKLEALGAALQSGAQLIPVLLSKWVYLGATGQTAPSLDVARQILDLAASGGEVDRLLGHRALGTTLVFAGRLEDAKAQLAAFMALYDPARHAAELASHGTSNHAAMTAVGLAEIAVLQQDDAAALHWGDLALHHARASGLGHDLCNVTLFVGCILPALRGRPDQTRAATDQLQTLAQAHALPNWAGYANLFRGMALLEAGEVEAGRHLAEASMAGILGSAAFLRFCLLFLADSCLKAGLPHLARQSLSQSELAPDGPESWLTAEVLRIDALLSAVEGKTAPDVAAQLARARDVALRQGAQLCLNKIALAEAALGQSAA